MPDHNVPASPDRLDRIGDPDSRRQIETLRENARGTGITFFDKDDIRQGIVLVTGPEFGLILPGITAVCGDSHTSTLGAFGAITFGIGTSEVEHALATQTLWRKRPREMRIIVTGEMGPGPTIRTGPRFRPYGQLRHPEVSWGEIVFFRSKPATSSKGGRA